jgi:hypothetical protein
MIAAHPTAHTQACQEGRLPPESTWLPEKSRTRNSAEMDHSAGAAVRPVGGIERLAIVVLGLVWIVGCGSEPESVQKAKRDAELEHSQQIMEQYEAKEQ